MYNECDSRTSRHKIMLDSLACPLNQSISQSVNYYILPVCVSVSKAPQQLSSDMQRM